MALEPVVVPTLGIVAVSNIGIASDTEACDTETGQQSAGFTLRCWQWLNQHCWRMNYATVLCKVG
eukprot:2536137-Amphidinium_carterae.1